MLASAVVNVGCLLKAGVLHRLSLVAGAVTVQCCAVAEGPDSYCSRAVASNMGKPNVPCIPRETQSVP